MAESLIVVGAKNVHTWNRTIGANSVEDEFNLIGEYPLASYSVDFDGISIANAGDDIIQIMAGASLNVRIRSIDVYQAGLATAVSLRTFVLARVTSAGTGGTAITPSKMDNGDAAAGCTAASGVPNATHGTIGATIRTTRLVMSQAILATATQALDRFHWEQKPGMKPIIIPAGTTNGIVLRNATATAGASLTGTIELVETSFL